MERGMVCSKKLWDRGYTRVRWSIQIRKLSKSQVIGWYLEQKNELVALDLLRAHGNVTRIPRTRGQVKIAFIPRFYDCFSFHFFLSHFALSLRVRATRDFFVHLRANLEGNRTFFFENFLEKFCRETCLWRTLSYKFLSLM